MQFFLGNATTSEMSESVFTGNKAQRGGAIFNLLNIILCIQESTFTSNHAHQWGGAIDNELNVTLCIFESTLTSNHAVQVGGAVYGFNAVSVTINSSYFSRNWVSNRFGGALHIGQSQLFLTSCQFEDNFSKGSGGAISAYYHSILKIIDTNFTRNNASISGGALWAFTSEISIRRCFLIGNRAIVFGGSLYIGSKSVSIELTKFMKNSGIEGGAIFAQNAELKTETCTFEKNVAIHKGGTIKADDDSSIVIANCHFLSNKAMDGGAVHLHHPIYSFISDTTFLKNMASQEGGAVKHYTTFTTDPRRSVIFENITCIRNQAMYGGCLCILSAVLILKSSIVMHNHASSRGAAIGVQDSRIQVGSSFKQFTDKQGHFADL